jgi:hypothetical protein
MFPVFHVALSRELYSRLHNEMYLLTQQRTKLVFSVFVAVSFHVSAAKPENLCVKTGHKM